METEIEAGWMEEALRKRLTELLPEMDGQASLVSAALSRNQGLRSMLLLHRDNAKKEIKDFCHQLLKLITDCQKSLVDEVTYLTQLKEKRLLKEREQLNTTKERIIYCRERAGVILKVGHEELLTQKGKEVIGDIKTLLATNISEAPMDIQYLSFHPVRSPSEFKEAESLGYVKSTAIELPDVTVTSLCDQAFVGLTELLTLRVAKKPIPEGANVIEVQIMDPKGGLVDWEVEDNDDGSYSITYTPELVGLHFLTVKIYRSHIKGSPFRVAVSEKSEAESVIDDLAEKSSRPRISEGAINTVNRLLVRRSFIKKGKAKSGAANGHLNELVEMQNSSESAPPETYDPMRNEGPFYTDQRGEVSKEMDVSVKGRAVNDLIGHSVNQSGEPINLTVQHVTHQLHGLNVHGKSLHCEGESEAASNMQSSASLGMGEHNSNGESSQKWIRPGGWLENAKKGGMERNDVDNFVNAKSARISDSNNNHQDKMIDKNVGTSRSDAQNWRVKQSTTVESNDLGQSGNYQLPNMPASASVGSGDAVSSQWGSKSTPAAAAAAAMASTDDSSKSMNGSAVWSQSTKCSNDLHINITPDLLVKSEPLSPLLTPPSASLDVQLSRGISSPETSVGSCVVPPRLTVKSEPAMEVHSDLYVWQENNSAGKSVSPFHSGGSIKGRGRQSSASTPRKEPSTPGASVSRSAVATCLESRFTTDPVSPSISSPSSAEKSVSADAAANITSVKECVLARARDISESAKLPQSPVKQTEVPKTVEKPSQEKGSLIMMSPSAIKQEIKQEEIKPEIKQEVEDKSETGMNMKHASTGKQSVEVNHSTMVSVQPIAPLMPRRINYMDVAVVFQKTVTSPNIEFPIGVHATKDMLAVGNSGGDTVSLFSPTGQLTREIGGSCHSYHLGKGQKTFKRPSAVLIHDEKLFIKDDVNVHVYDPQGNYRYSFSKCKFKQPYGLILTPSGTLLVLEHSTATVFEFYTNGAVADTWSFAPLVNSQRGAKCRFLGVHGSTLVVTDLGLNAIHFIDMSNKSWVKSITHARDSAQGYFNEPSGVTFDPAGNLLIADSRNNRIQVFTIDGQFITVLPLPKGKLYRPADIHLTEDGTLYVANLLGHNISVFKILY